jgi:uncharacterized membrane protein YkoI
MRRRWLLGGALSLGLVAGSVGAVIATDGDEDDAADRVPAGSDRDAAAAAGLEAAGGGTVTSVETGDEGGAYGVEVSGTAGEVEVTLDQAFAVLGTESDSSSDGDGSGSDDLPPGADHDRAVEAALALTGGGTVTDVETGDDGAAFGVEVLKADGTEVEVQIDASFNATGEEVDD